MGLREGDRVRDRGVRQDGLLDLPRRHLLAAAVDDLLEPPTQEEVAVGVEVALVSGTKPAARECLPVRVGIPFVAREDTGAANGDLAELAGCQHAAVLIQDGDLCSGGEPDGAGLSLPWRERVHCHLMRRLGHPVGLDHRAAEELLDT